MQELYRITVCPYHYEHWSVYTKDKVLFSHACECDSTEDLEKSLGTEAYENLVESYVEITYPMILLGETEVRQYD